MNFATAFQHLTGHAPFPWQQSLYKQFAIGNIPPSCNLPTGLGKTNVIAVWLIALANGANVPRRLVYVVNRRTVVDQTTDEVEKYKKNLEAAGITQPLAVSTLRGQFADNRDWSADPSRPAVICGTVDMIGSRLLFSGYGVGFKGKPLHAGFLGQDALLIHDEAHLEPAFQKLIETIRDEQARCKDFNPLRVMELTATSRGRETPFGLTDEDRKNATVLERVSANKAVHLVKEEKKLADQLAAKAEEFDDKNRAVLVFARTVDDVMKIRDKLPKGRVETLTGTMRGKERDELVKKPLFQRFMPGGQSDAETIYLVCTSAGEVGVNISADHLVCDLTTFDSMAQRFGRVNRFGRRADSEIHVVYPAEFGTDDYGQRREKTLKLLRNLNGDGSPDALGRLDAERRQEAFAPTPTLLPATDILFDAWALTTIKDKLPGRPPVADYLHGLSEWESPQVSVAWREEVWQLRRDFANARERVAFQKSAGDVLESYPVKHHELLSDQTKRVLVALKKLPATPEMPVWVVEEDGRVEVTSFGDLVGRDDKTFKDKTILLPPHVGGLERGLLDGSSKHDEKRNDYDVADEWCGKDGRPLRARVWDDEDVPEGMSVIATIDTKPDEDSDEPSGRRFWHQCAVFVEENKNNRHPVAWAVHVNDVVNRATEIVGRLSLDESLKRAIIAAAHVHDHGKRRASFQRILGNFKNAEPPWAKSGTRNRTNRLKEDYRHEFGSLVDLETVPEFTSLEDEMKDLVRHLVAAHHGHARPHFPNPFDPDHSDTYAIAHEVPRRFARLQRKYGRWGLAYLESLLRAADWAASANPSAFLTEGEQ